MTLKIKANGINAYSTYYTPKHITDSMCCSGIHLSKEDLVVSDHFGIADGRSDVHLNAESSTPMSQMLEQLNLSVGFQ